MKPDVVIIGAGQIGHALGRAAAKNAKVSYWDVARGKVARQRPLVELLPPADMVLFCVPSWRLRQALKESVPHLSARAVSVFISKGLEAATGRSADIVARAALTSRRSFGFIGGPLLSDELLKGKLGAGVAASDRPPVLARILALFKDTNVTLETSTDLAGVIWSGVLKDVYALGMGAIDGLGQGLNAKGWYAARATAEASRLVGRFGGRPGTFVKTAGLGDLIATGFCPHSQNRQAGEKLIRYGIRDTESEGCRTLPVLKKRLGRGIRRYPLLSAIAQALDRPRQARQILKKLLPR